jgi:PAS domain S-box-containing protein
MMLVILAITALVLYFAERNVAADVQRNFREAFQSEIGHLLGVHEARRAAITERCRVLARAPRIRAALEEDSIEDLYINASIELRDILQAPGEPEDVPDARALRARFFRFLDSEGKVMPDPRKSDAALPKDLEARLALPSGPSAEQQIGYVIAKSANGETIHEIICTPIVATETGEVIGSIVLGFKPVAYGTTDRRNDLHSGLWIDHRLHMPDVEPAVLEGVGQDVVRALDMQSPARGNVMTPVHGTPHLVFTQLLNAGSQFAPAYHVCLYSLAGTLARQRQVQWQILGYGTLLLLGGLVASHFISASFSAPVEQLAVASAEHQTLRKRAEAALVLTEQKYRSIFENAVEGIFVLTPEARIVSVNPALARLFGYDSPAHFVAEVTDLAAQLFPDPKHFTEILNRAKTEGTVSGFETEAIRKDGRRIWISENVRAATDHTGEVSHLEGTIEDITERKHAGDALLVVNAELEKALGDLKSTQQQIIQQERLRALGQMASGIAHDFNNTLVPILGFSELLACNDAILRDLPAARKYLEIIQTAAKDASSVVARLREFYRSRDDRESFSAINLSKLVEQSVTLTKPRWKDQAQASGATIEVVTMLEAMPPVAGEESALREVFTNLIFNAVDALPKGGTITVRAFRLGESAVIEVADNGTGMTEEVRRRCLEPFFSTKGDRGTGLGLSMVFGIIQRHSGIIDIRSQVGQGTTFVITLPLDHSAVTSTGPEAQATALRALRILVVEDDLQVQELLAATLRADGHTVQMACHGIEGLKCFLDGTFDLILTDKSMPGMSGDQLATAIKQIAPKMPIILLTGFGQFLNAEDYPDVNVLAPKPISIVALREAMATALASV